MAARSSPRVDTGAVDRPCGLGRWGRGCWGPFWAGVWTHGHTGELPGHSRAQRLLQAEGGWVGLWSRVSGGRSLQWGGRGGGVECTRPIRVLPASCRAPVTAPRAGLCPRGLVLYLLGLLSPGPRATSLQPPSISVCVCVSSAGAPALWAHPEAPPPQMLHFLSRGRPFPTGPGDQDPHMSLRTTAQPTAASLRLPGCPGGASATLSARPLSQGYPVLRGLPPGRPSCLCPVPRHGVPPALCAAS